MRKYSLNFLICLIIIILSSCASQDIDTDNKPTLAVSIVPQEAFVKAVAGDLVDVVTMIPSGYSPANYQPTPQQMTGLSKAQLYFSIGVATEESNILPKLESLNQSVKVISLADKVGEVYPHLYYEGHDEYSEEHDDELQEGQEKHNHEGMDSHIWLSPKRVKIMIEVIRDELIKIDSNNEKVYAKNAEDYLQKLDKVDEEIKEALKDLSFRSFIIYHPSFAYFADDYGLNMVTIEEEGKQATAKRLEQVIDFAKKENIKVVFYQEEFDSHQAETIAQEIDGVTVKVAPLAADYIANLKLISEKFNEVLD